MWQNSPRSAESDSPAIACSELTVFWATDDADGVIGLHLMFCPYLLTLSGRHTLVHIPANQQL